MPPAVCIATLKTGDRAGERCTHAAKEGSDKCGKHRNWVAPPPRCIGVTKAGTQCMHSGESAEVPTCSTHRGTARTIDAVGVDVVVPPPCSKAGCRRGVTAENAQGECEYHARVRAHRARHQERVAMFRRIHDAYRALRPPLALGNREPGAVLREMQRVSLRVFHHLANFGVEQTDENIRVVVAIFPMRDDAVVIEEDIARQELWNGLFGGGGGAGGGAGAGGGIAPPPNTLAGIAASRQSVHAPEVVQQAVRGADFLLKVKIPSGWDDESKVLDELKALWPGEENAPLHADIRMWWNTPSCFAKDDKMYRRLLTGLWTYVKSEEDAERRKELEKRMFQECSEAVRMCCQGHTNRLVNVLSGFVPGVEIVVPQPKGEILQQQFALIGAMENAEERTRRANEVIAELALTADEAAPWLEAIA